VRLAVAAATHDYAVVGKVDALGESRSLLCVGNASVIKMRLVIRRGSDDLKPSLEVEEQDDLAPYWDQRKAGVGTEASFARETNWARTLREAGSDLCSSGLDRRSSPRLSRNAGAMILSL
jgi:hypothetical protein